MRKLSAQQLYHILTYTATSSEKRVDYWNTVAVRMPWLTWYGPVGGVQIAGWKDAWEDDCRRNAGNTICPSLFLFSHLFCFSDLLFSFISPLFGTRDGLNGDIVASWEQYPDAVWVCKAELQHQWFCCQGEDYISGELTNKYGCWMMMNNVTVQ